MTQSSNKKNLFISNLRNFSKREYGVSVTYYKQNEENPYKRIDYEAIIALDKMEKGWLFTLDKKKVFFNQHEPHLISERFGNIVSKSIYPVQTIINGWGTQIDGIVNHKEIINRWELNKQKLTNKYEGDVINEFISSTDKKIKNSSLIQRSMKYDLFWNLFFHPKYMSYGNDYALEQDMYLAIIPYKYPVRFPGVQEIIPEVSDYNSVQILFRSKELLAPKEVLHDITTDDYLMKLTVDFDLDKEHHFIMHTKAIFEIFKREGKHTTIPVKKMQFTMYQL